MVEFSSDIFYRTTDIVQGGSLEERWFEGIWLGKKNISGEHIIASREGPIVKSSCIRQRTEAECWNPVCVLRVAGTPWNLSGKVDNPEEPATIPYEAPTTTTDTHDDVNDFNETRDFHINRVLLEKYGFTEGCNKCRSMMRGEAMRKGHTEGCRKRINDFMMKDEEEKRTVEAAKNRKTEEEIRRSEFQEEREKKGLKDPPRKARIWIL